MVVMILYFFFFIAPKKLQNHKIHMDVNFHFLCLFLMCSRKSSRIRSIFHTGDISAIFAWLFGWLLLFVTLTVNYGQLWSKTGGGVTPILEHLPVFRAPREADGRSTPVHGRVTLHTSPWTQKFAWEGDRQTDKHFGDGHCDY